MAPPNCRQMTRTSHRAHLSWNLPKVAQVQMGFCHNTAFRMQQPPNRGQANVLIAALAAVL